MPYKFRKQLETNARVSKRERSLLLLPIGHTEKSVEFVTDSASPN